MESLVRRHLRDPRFAKRAGIVSQTAVTPWYASSALPADRQLKVTTHLASAYAAEKKQAKSEDAEPNKKKRKKKDTDSGGNASTSDGSDGGPCWSDYERTPGTKEGTKGSCKPKNKD
jgi:hypothetical protein